MTSKKADKVLTLDEKTGQVEAVPVGEETAKAAPPKRSYQIDDDSGYTSTILIDEHKVFIRELSKAEFAEYMRASQEAADSMIQVQKDSEKGGADPAAQAKRSLEVSDRQAGLYGSLVERHVKGWMLQQPDGSKLPCNNETKAKLPISVQCEMAMKILQKSRLGRDESGF